VFDGEVSRAWCAFVEGLAGSQSILGAAEQVDFDGEGVAVADGRGRDVRTSACRSTRRLRRWPVGSPWAPRDRRGIRQQIISRNLGGISGR